MASADGGNKSDWNKGERVVDDQRKGGGKVKAPGEWPVHRAAVDVGLHVERAVTAHEAVAESQLGMARVGVAGNAGVTCGDDFARF